jgi:HK97 family phage portal protein
MNILGFNITRAATPADLLIQKRSDLANPSPWLREALGGSPAAAGVSVTEERAMGLTAVFSCVSRIATTMSALPLKFYRNTNGARELAKNHPLYRVLHHRFNPMMTAMQGREVMGVHLEGWGNAYAEIQRNGRGEIVALWPIPPNMVRVEKVTAPDPRRIYHVAGVARPFTQDEIFHVAGIGFDGVVGKSPIRVMREALAIGIAAEQYGAKFFANDAGSGVYLETEGSLTDEQFERLQREWSGYEGSTQAWRTKILEAGLKLHRIGLPPADAQFLETRKFTRSEICGWYGVPPHMIGDTEKSTSWGTGIEQQAIGFVTFTLMPRFVRMEQAILTQLLDEDEQDEYYAEHVAAGLLRGDTAARFQAYKIARDMGVLNANQIAELENWDRLPGDKGEAYWRPMNMVEVGAEVAPPRAPADERSLEPLFTDAFRRFMRRETKAVRHALRKHDITTEEGRIAFAQWAEEHTRQHAEWLQLRLLPLFDVAVKASDTPPTGDDLDALVFAHAARVSGQSRAQLLKALEASPASVEALLDEWEEKRYQKDADVARRVASLAGLTHTFSTDDHE